MPMLHNPAEIPADDKPSVQWTPCSGGRMRSACVLALTVIATVAGCDRSPVEVESAALDVRVDVAPVVISASSPAEPARLRVTVSVTNPHWRRAVVHLGGPPYRSGAIPAAQTHGIGFGARIVYADGRPGGGPSQWTWGRPTFTFGPRQTLRHEFVFGPEGGPAGAAAWSPQPGSYWVIASFGRHEAAAASVVVRP